MATKSKKRQYSGRNTGSLYWRLSQLPDYNVKYRELIKEGAINDLYITLYGENHRKSLHLRDMTDRDYQLLLDDLDRRIKKTKTLDDYYKQEERRRKISKIFKAFERMGLRVTGNYEEVNTHIKRIALSKGRIIPQIPTEELDTLYKAVCSYCDYYVKKQKEEHSLTLKN